MVVYTKDTQLALIHIPLPLYYTFLQPILALLLPAKNRPDSSGSDGISNARPRTWPYEHPFVNVSVTPVECSVVCSRVSAEKLFLPVLEALPETSRSQVSVGNEDFIVMQVDGEGLDAGQRVLELTSPLAMAGISIFFITTYFSDYILVPLRCRGQVVHALEDRGFQFEQNTSTYVNPTHQRRASTDIPPPPGTPPPATVHELQTRTFATLKRRHIVPTVDSELRLIQCAGSRDSSIHTNGNDSKSFSPQDDALHLGLVKCFITLPHPPFLSLTLTDTEPASVLLEQSLVSNFTSRDNVLLGTQSDCLIPITLDLRDLPLEATGIVCGVAGRLVGGTAHGSLQSPVEMSYLSTARAGTVMVSEDELDRALEALKGGENGVLAD
ncbi:hypothetical protein EJ05DRAFT_504515 [Pseudovirgaria hyperparasitica]|uniref:CASTOR ACT domain-containing protein n=1 Tax=Pseudovirgaria hyperparasitica TaxID=470096 RepID=A0A6A6VTA7_9PEZI|nr:uncharacterized protein EJ05DRAFT_504515 [Pseudovirgaria hyperparasitica]KAF2753918.1 hypothetical protein EJ05DRAFT_504515 [Pseudovirgaria hyperparasitica]